MDCAARISRLTALMDDAEKNKFDPLKEKSSNNPDTYWKTVNGHSLQMVGPGTAELNPNDYIALFSRVQRYGAPGQELVDKTKRALEMVDINSSTYTWRALEFVKDFTPDEKINLWEVIEGRSAKGLQPGDRMPAVGSQVIDPISPRVANAVQFLNSAEGSGGLLDHLAGIAHREGILSERLEHYKPILYPTELLENAQFKETAHSAFAKEQAQLRMAREQGKKPSEITVTNADITPEDQTNARLIFDRYVIPQYAAVAPHLELQRQWDVAGQITDPDVLLPVYIKQMWRRIAEKRIFGERDHLHDFPTKAKQLLGQIESTDGSKAADEALILVKDFVGINPADPTMNSAIMRTLSNMQGLKLSGSAFRNFTQQVNTAMRGDFGSLAKSWGLYIKDGELNGYNVRELAKDIASAADLALYDSSLYRAHDTFGRVVEGTLKYTGFSGTERLNRTFTGIAGAVYADKQARRLLDGGKHASQRLLELGIDPDIVRQNGGISQQDMLLAGRRFIDETQFRTRAGDLPFFAQDPMWKFLLQFRTFTINQTRFILREAQRRPLRLGAFALTAMPAVGMAADLMQDAALELLPWFEPRERKRNSYEAYWESFASAGAFGLVSDLAWSSYMAGESKVFADFFTPPGIGTLNDMSSVAGELARGKGRPAARDFFRQFGGLGAAFGRYIVPPEKQRKGAQSTLDEVGELSEWLSL